ncbi:MAG: PA0069 family radical SAM protein [Opitutaceae bacterium]
MADTSHNPVAPPSGSSGGARGTALTPANRFEQLHVEPDPDTQETTADESVSPRTQFFVDASESVLTANDSPDVDFAMGLNPYRGCEHGCAYCYARPFHEYLGWNSGIDFESRILVKTRAPSLLRDELAAARWIPQVVGMSGVTDCYQPAERHFQLTRECLRVFAEFRNPVGIITKNALISRDLDVLAELARWKAVAVHITLTTLDTELSGRLEPRAARPNLRLRVIRDLANAGVPVSVLIAPVIPGLTDHEIPALLAAAAEAGAQRAGYILLRLPHAVKDIFIDWLDRHAPTRKERVLSRIRDLRGGQLNVSSWGQRMKGEGIFAEQIHALFNASARRAGLNRARIELSVEHFRRPGGVQLNLL